MTIDDQIASVEREIALRCRVYPNWVRSGKMKQQKADHELRAMSATLGTLKAVNSDPASAAALIAQHRAALEQCVRVAQMWHGDEAFDIYFNLSPEMKPIREVLGAMPEPAFMRDIG